VLCPRQHRLHHSHVRLEAVRTRPYHFRAYNLAAMIVRSHPLPSLRILLTNTLPQQTNARLVSHLGFDAWNLISASGGTINTALDSAMTVAPGDEDATELYPSIGAVAAVYGDAGGKYAKFLASAEQNYPARPWFFYN